VIHYNGHNHYNAIVPIRAPISLKALPQKVVKAKQARIEKEEQKKNVLAFYTKISHEANERAEGSLAEIKQLMEWINRNKEG
jgi:hypothetical protein